MSVFTVLWLDCNGPRCTARFIPSQPVSLSPALRLLAASQGWVVLVGKKYGDYCPACAVHTAALHAWARGTCSVCGVPRTVTAAGTVALHRFRRLACDGGGLPPAQVVHHGQPSAARTPYPGWKESA